MAKISGTVNRVGNFLIREEWRDKNLCRDDVVIDLTGMPAVCAVVQGESVAQVGAVVYEPSLALGTYIVVDASYVPVTDKVGILVDERLGDPTIYTVAEGQVHIDITTDTTDTATLAILNGGTSMVRKGGLIYPAAQEANVLAGLADAGITVIDQLEGFDSKATAKAFTSI